MSTHSKKNANSNGTACGLATMVSYRAGIWEEMERDPTVFLIGEDVGTYGGAFKD